MSRATSFMKFCAERELACWICGEEIDYGPGARKAANRDRSFSLDHYWPISLRPELKSVRSNWKPSHALCNSRRSSRTPEDTIWIGSMREGHWHDETQQRASKRKKKEHEKRNRPPSPKFKRTSTPLPDPPPLSWSERWGKAGPVDRNGIPIELL